MVLDEQLMNDFRWLFIVTQDAIVSNVCKVSQLKTSTAYPIIFHIIIAFFRCWIHKYKRIPQYKM
jgi:hypothetical protein